jgi:hypothetical protein
MSDPERITATIRDFGLDSLQTAGLSVMLANELRGREPFTEGEMPQSAGKIIDFYAR